MLTILAGILLFAFLEVVCLAALFTEPEPDPQEELLPWEPPLDELWIDGAGDA